MKQTEGKIAVFAGDLVGFTALMERDPRRTIRAVEESRQIMADTADRHDGTLVDSAGDFLLAKFKSPHSSLVAAAEFQRSISDMEILDIAFRIGIDFGLLYESGANIYGNTVNIAARLQQLAQAGGIVVSGEAKKDLPDKDEYEFGLLGEIKLKNVSRRVSVYELHECRNIDGAQKFPFLEKHSKRPQLYFKGIGAIGRSEHAKVFADSLSDELATSLGALSGTIFVRNREEVEAMGSRYELSGQVRNTDRLRITAHLRSLQDNALIWSGRFDYGVDASYEAQEEIARKVISAAQIELTDGEWARIWSDRPTSVTARDNFQRARAMEATVSRATWRKAKEYYRAVLEEDPEFCPAMVGLAFCMLDEMRLCWTDSEDDIMTEIKDLHQRASTLAPEDLYAECLSAFIDLWEDGPDVACKKFKSFLNDHPESPEFIAFYARLLGYAGKIEECVRENRRALELTRHPPHWIHTNLGFACLDWDDAQAMVGFTTALAIDPVSIHAKTGMAAICAKGGHIDAASRWAKEVLALDPQFNAERWHAATCYKNKDWHARVTGWLKEAGL